MGGASAVAFFVAGRLPDAAGDRQRVWLGAVLLWLVLLLKTWRGETWRVPIAGDLAMKIAGV